MPDHEINKDQKRIQDDKQDVREGVQGVGVTETPGELRQDRKDLHEDKHEIRQDRRDDRRD